MHLFPRFLCLVCLSLFAAAAAHADLTIVQNVEGAGPVATSTTKIKGDRARVEAGPGMTTIIDSKTGEILTLLNDQKSFIRVSAAQARAAAELAVQSNKKGAPAVRPQLKPTGKKETINGYETQEYTCDAPAFKGSYWIATNYPNAKAILAQMAATTPKSWNVAGTGMPDYRDFPGMPIRMRVSVNGKEIITTLASVKEDPLPASDFVPPPDFQEVKMPDVDALKGAPTKAEGDPTGNL